MAVVIPLSDDVAGDVRKRNLWYERLPFTGSVAGGPFALAAGPNPIFSLDTINGGAKVPAWRMHLQGLAATQLASAYMTITYDKTGRLGGTATSGSLAAVRAGVRPDPYVDVAALSTMAMLVQASAGAANFQMNYNAAFKRLTAAEKLLLSTQGTTIPLSKDEQAALSYGTGKGQGQPLNIAKGVQQGKILVPWVLEMEHRFQAYVTKVETLWLYGAGLANADTPIGEAVYAADNEILVVRNVAVENDPSTNQLPTAVLAMTSDGYPNYLGWSCQAFADADDDGLDMFVPCIEKVDFTGQSANDANLPARATVWRVDYTEALKIRTGELSKAEAGERFFYQVIGGAA